MYIDIYTYIYICQYVRKKVTTVPVQHGQILSQDLFDPMGCWDALQVEWIGMKSFGRFFWGFLSPFFNLFYVFGGHCFLTPHLICLNICFHFDWKVNLSEFNLKVYDLYRQQNRSFSSGFFCRRQQLWELFQKRCAGIMVAYFDASCSIQPPIPRQVSHSSSVALWSVRTLDLGIMGGEWLLFSGRKMNERHLQRTNMYQIGKDIVFQALFFRGDLLVC